MSDLIKVCRLCTSCKNVSLTINNSDSDHITYFNKLNKISPGILESGNKLPNGICTTCISELNDAYKFINKCYKAQNILKRNLNQLQGTEIITINEEINCGSEINSDNSNKENSATFEFIKVEQLENEEYSEENTIKLQENILLNIKQERNSPINVCNSEKESNFIDEAVDKTEQSNFNLEEDILGTEEGTNKNHSDLAMIQEKNNYGIINLENSNTKRLEQRDNKTRKNDKRYICKICNRTFVFSSQLTRHFRCHTNERPYKCDICEKSFKLNYNLKMHIRTHTLERPYRCEICDKAFSENGNLKKHIRIHKNEKPYTCKLCGKAFVQSGNLKIHSLVHIQETM